MRWLTALYDRRIINVNVNIIVAGILALIPTAFAAHAADRFLGVNNNLLIVVITFVVDAISDVGVYYLLHYIANYMPRATPRANTSPAYAHVPYIKDATLVQFERMCLSPLLYVVALGSQYALMEWWQVGSASATVVGFTLGITVSRALHTIWMLRAEQRAKAVASSVGNDSTNAPIGSNNPT